MWLTASLEELESWAQRPCSQVDASVIPQRGLERAWCHHFCAAGAPVTLLGVALWAAPLILAPGTPTCSKGPTTPRMLPNPNLFSITGTQLVTWMDAPDWWNTGNLHPPQLQGILAGYISAIFILHWERWALLLLRLKSGKFPPNKKEVNKLGNQKNNYPNISTKKSE